MTSNLGLKNLSQPEIGFNRQDHTALNAEQRSKINKEMKQTFKPEFINRLTDSLVFNSLSRVELIKIVDLILDDVSNYANEKNIKIKLSAAAKAMIIDQEIDSEYGARPLHRIIQNMIEDRIAEMTLKGEVKNESTVNITVKKKVLDFSVIQTTKKKKSDRKAKSLNGE